MSIGGLRSGLLAVLMLGFATNLTHAATPTSRDDRSSAQSLVRSFYNAINRHEYARAYTYFGGRAPKVYKSFAQGYGDTISVRVVTGETISEGAMGSVYFIIPVAIDALSSNGRHRQFAGCYTMELIEPTIQDPPVTPMVIQKATLHGVRGDIATLLPDCGYY